MSASTGTVKAVLSGDTIVVVGKAVGNVPPQEIVLTLASISAPKISRGPAASNVEEPFGWESRELLRKYCIGKPVTFKIIYCVSSINRAFADVELVGPGETSLAKHVVEAGMATVTPSNVDGKTSSCYEDLQSLEEEAKEDLRGMHAASADDAKHLRKPVWSPSPAEVEEILSKYKGKPVAVVVEYVRDGSTLRVLILDCMTYISFSLAGILCPRVVKGSREAGEASSAPASPVPSSAASTSSVSPRNGGTAPMTSDPFALQARLFTELRLLNREVEVLMQGQDRAGNIVGTVLHPKGNIAVEIVRCGLARVHDRSLTHISKETTLALRLAEREAQTKKVFIWSTVAGADDEASASVSSSSNPKRNPLDVPGTPSSSFSVRSSAPLGIKQFEGVVTEVLSGDTFMVLPDDADKGKNGDDDSEDGQGDTCTGAGLLESRETRVTLSSIRAPRLGNSKGDGYELWANECKECVRSRLIGRRVRIIVDYEKPFASTHFMGATDTSRASTMRSFATVKVLPSMRNVALMLLQEGLVTCSTRITAATALVSPTRSAGKAGGNGTPSYLSEKNYSCEFESAGYLVAEAEAAAKGRGLHGASPPPGLPVTANSPGMVDFTMDTKKAKPFLLQLIQKAAAAPTPPSSSSGVDARAAGVCYYRGAVEFVYSGSRIKVLIPSENCLLSLTLAQVRCPLPSRAVSSPAAASSSSSARLAEPLSDESRAFTRRHVQQRTVELRIDDVDKNGVALGRLYVQVQVAPPPGMPTTPSGGALNKPPLAPSFMIRPYAVILVSEGLARVDRKFKPPVEDPVSDKEMGDLLAAQEAAMAAGKGIWGIPGNIEAEREANAPPSAPAPADADGDGDGDEEDKVKKREDEVDVSADKVAADVAVAPVAPVAASDATKNSAGGEEKTGTPESKIHHAKVDARGKNASSMGGIKPSGPLLRGDEEKVVVRLSAVIGGTSFFVHPQTETRQKQLLGLQSLLEEFVPDAAGKHAVDAGCVPKKGQLLLALVDGDRAPGMVVGSQDALWYRCRVDDVLSKGDYTPRLRVQFIDYGSRTVVALDEVAVLDGSNGHPPSNSGLHTKYFATSALATECALAFLAAPDADDDDDGSMWDRAVEFLGDEVWNKELTMQVLGVARGADRNRGAGAGRLLVALYDDGGEGALSAASEENTISKVNGKPALFLTDLDPDLEESAETGSEAGAKAAASPWGTRFTWGSVGSLSNLGSASEAEVAADADAAGDADSISLKHSVSEMSLGDIIAAEEAAAAAALKSPTTTGTKTMSINHTHNYSNSNTSSNNNNGSDERIVSLNEKVLMEGLARLSRSATRLLPRGNGSNSSNNSNASSSSGGAGAEGGKRVPRPPSLTPLATALYEHLLEAQAAARRSHLNMYRYGDPPQSDDDRDERNKDIKGKDKK